MSNPNENESKNQNLSTYNWGIIGCGTISYDFATCLLIHPRCKIFACASRDKKSADKFGHDFKIPKENCFGSYEDFYKCPDIDIVYVGTIHPSHKDNVINCLNNGKHVLVEKPMGMNDEEVKEMIEAANKNKKFLLEGMWTRFFPAIKQTRKWIKDNKIGEVIGYHGDFGSKMPTYEQSPRLYDINLGGGCTLDLGIYLISLITLCFGEIKPIKINGFGVLDDKHKCDIISNANILFNDNKYASIQSTFLTNTPREFNILGTKGRIRIEYPSHAPHSVSLHIYHGSSIIQKDSREFALPIGPFPRNFHYKNSNGFMYEIDETIKCLDQNKLECEEYTLNESLIAAQISTEIRKQIGIKYSQDKW